jgi:hypothetical protein
LTSIAQMAEWEKKQVKLIRFVSISLVSFTADQHAFNTALGVLPKPPLWVFIAGPTMLWWSATCYPIHTSCRSRTSITLLLTLIIVRGLQ